jgi:hypothetical protein
MGVRSFLSLLKWLLLAAVAAIAPWLPLLFDFKLTSDYFQPALNIAASLLAVLALPIGHFIHRQSSRKGRDLWLFCLWLPFLVLCLGACVYLTLNVGSIFAGTRLTNAALWALWIFLYLGIFFSLGMILSLMALSISKKKS